MKIKTICLTAAALLIFAAKPSLAAEYGGNGTASDPYLISTAEQLKEFAEEVSAGNAYAGAYFKLTESIDLNGGADNAWIPAGWSETANKSFAGTFDGGGYTISGLYINSFSDYQGLFCSIAHTGTVKNLTVEGSVKGGNYVGGIAGENSSGKIEDCVSAVSVTAGSYAGGIVGQNTSGTLSGCSNSGSVSSSVSCAGGITGKTAPER